MGDLYAIAYQIIAPLMILSGGFGAATLDRLTISGRPRLIVLGMWLVCSASVLIGIGLLLDVRGTLFGEIVLGTGDVALALAIPLIIGSYWWETRRDFAARRSEYFSKTKRGGSDDKE
jgi:hypothetical protein